MHLAAEVPAPLVAHVARLGHELDRTTGAGPPAQAEALEQLGQVAVRLLHLEQGEHRHGAALDQHPYRLGQLFDEPQPHEPDLGVHDVPHEHAHLLRRLVPGRPEREAVPVVPHRPDVPEPRAGALLVHHRQADPAVLQREPLQRHRRGPVNGPAHAPLVQRGGEAQDARAREGLLAATLVTVLVTVPIPARVPVDGPRARERCVDPGVELCAERLQHTAQLAAAGGEDPVQRPQRR